MPRGVKGSGKAATSKVTAKKKVVPAEKANTPVKARKAYPSREERISMADKQIARLSKLNDSRRALVAKTEAILADRKTALEKSVAQLNKAVARKERLSATPEKLASTRQAKKEEKKKLDELMSKIKATGKSVEEIFEKFIHDPS